MNKELIYITCLIIGMVLISIVIKISCFSTLKRRLMSREELPEIRNDLSGIRVALYFSHGMDEHHALAMGRAFQWMGSAPHTSIVVLPIPIYLHLLQIILNAF